MQEKTEEQKPVTQPAQPAIGGVRKRQQIQDINKHTFIWLAVASVIVSICLIALQFLIREFMFNQKVINKKIETSRTLKQNIKEADKLRENVNALLADNNLNSLKYEAPNTKTTALNVILDALPVEGDATAFANSLQAVVLPRSGVGIRELNTASTTLVGSPTDASGAVSADSAEALPLPFTAGFSGKYGDVAKALSDLSHVIRPINLNTMTIRASDNDGLQVAIGGSTYYLPARTVEVRTEQVKP